MPRVAPRLMRCHEIYLKPLACKLSSILIKLRLLFMISTDSSYTKNWKARLRSSKMDFSQIKPIKLIVPGLFLLVLGIGNISVGIFKGNQYDLVLEELAHHKPSPALVNASPLRRIQVARTTASRIHQRQQKAGARRHFYRLVTFGGKVFVSLSIIFLLLALLLTYTRFTRSEKNSIE